MTCSKTYLTQFSVRAAIVALLFVMTGCQDGSVLQPATRTAEPVPYTTLEELTTTLIDGSNLVLIEFGVPSGCPSCDQMREPIERLASNLRERVTVRRVDLNEYLQLAWELKLTEFPTYVAFRDGEEVFRAAHPTSIDHITSGLSESLGDFSAEQLAIAAR